MKALLGLAPALFLLAACAVTSSYGPATDAEDFGYREQQIEADRYRISYRAEDFSKAMDGALRRAAELTVQNGYDYFTVVSRDSELDRTRGYGPSVGIGGSTGSRSSGVGVGISLPLGGGTREGAIARLEMVMGRGVKPEGIESYQAREVLANLVR